MLFCRKLLQNVLKCFAHVRSDIILSRLEISCRHFVSKPSFMSVDKSRQIRHWGLWRKEILKKSWKKILKRFCQRSMWKQIVSLFSMSMSVNKLVCKYNIELRKKSSKSSQKSLAWYRNEPSLDLLELKMSSNLANMTKRAKI